MKIIHFTFLHSIIIASIMLCASGVSAQVASHPEATSPVPENPYLKHTDPWRWDVRTQIFLRAGFRYYSNSRATKNSSTEQTESIWWAMKDLEVIFPAVRQGGFYWSPNTDVEASLRAGDFKREQTQQRMFTKDSKAEYTLWRSDVEENVHQIHLIHISHIVTADTIFDHKKAQHLPWPKSWDKVATGFLSPVVDSVGAEVDADAADTIKTLLDFWVEKKDPKGIPQLDLVKFLTGKVIEHVQVRGPGAEFSKQSINRNSLQSQTSSTPFITGTAWGGFVVRPANVVARDGKGTKHDLATLLTAVLRSAGVPARTVLCVNRTDQDILERMVSMVEFAMYDPDRDITFWVPIDIDRLRLNGKRASQYKQWWNYFGTHDQLNDYVPIAYYFHPPASYRAYDLPALYGMRSSSRLPEYVIQSLLIDPQMSPITTTKKRLPNQP